MTSRPRQQSPIEAAILAGDLAGKVVCCHAAMRSFSPRIDTSALLNSFLDQGITLLVPTFTYDFEVPAPRDDEPANNGMDYRRTWKPKAEMFSAAGNALSRGPMGALPAELLAHAGRRRGEHPLNSFSAVGPLASRLIDGQTCEDVYYPLRQLVAHGGRILLLGTDTRSLTFVHYAEQLAGRSLFIRWARSGNQVVRTRVGSCSNGFDQLMPVMLDNAIKVECQGSTWLSADAQTMLAALAGVISTQPQITRCKDPACLRCEDAIAGGPL